MNIQPAQVLGLKDLADYQTGAVVSRTVIDKKTGTVTAFAFDQGQGLSEHTSPYDALVQVTDGTAEILIAGQRSTVEAGQMILMPAGKPHALRAVTSFKMILILIR